MHFSQKSHKSFLQTIYVYLLYVLRYKVAKIETELAGVLSYPGVPAKG